MSAGSASLGERIEALDRQVAALRLELAQARRDERPAGGAIGALRCEVDGFGEVLLAGEIDEVVAAASLVAVPESPPWVPGLLDVRGALVPVIDLAARFSNRARALSVNDHFVLVRVDGRAFALVVQETRELLRVAVDRLGRIPPDLPFARYVLGVAPGEGTQAVVIAVAALVALAAAPEERG